MPGSELKDLLQIWSASVINSNLNPPFANPAEMLDCIDATTVGNIASWQSFTLRYQGELGDGPVESWKVKDFEVFFRDPEEVLHSQLGNPDFAGEMDFAPKQEFNAQNHRVYQDFMSGNWSWRQVDQIADDPRTHGATFCPAIFGSDKTTVSVGTGQNEYYPFYMSNGLIHNNVRRAHRNGVTLIGFFSIPKTDREHTDSREFRESRRMLFHASIRRILQLLRPGMEEPQLVRYGDGYYRKTIWGIGPYIADYPEQCLLACIVQGWCARCTAKHDDLDGPGGRRSHEHTEGLYDVLDKKRLWDDYGIIEGIMPFTYGFPRADIHDLLSPDILHQIIKGTFKDHLVAWVQEYIELVNTPARARQILADIDRRGKILFPRTLVNFVPPRTNDLVPPGK
ncbi:hypothetical protein C8J56DRAFT_1049095 [Mycena floridula]|nr:hypothetical protein C8J56DRAFT_1049095 [Mycena floridula]